MKFLFAFQLDSYGHAAYRIGNSGTLQSWLLFFRYLLKRRHAIYLNAFHLLSENSDHFINDDDGLVESFLNCYERTSLLKINIVL